MKNLITTLSTGRAAMVVGIAFISSIFIVTLVDDLLVLALDAIIGLALYIVLKPSNKDLAALTAILRLLYAFTLIIGVSALALQSIDVYDYASIKLLGYVFFALHIFVLGYSVFKSDYIPKSLGILLVVASFTYIVFFVDFLLPETVKVITMLTMAVSELLLSIWLIAKRKRLPEN